MLGEVKSTDFRRYLNLNNYTLKTSRCSYRSIYINIMVTTNHELTTDTQKTKRNNPNIMLKKITKPQRKRLKEEEIN